MSVPVRIESTVHVIGRLSLVTYQIPEITAADAFDANDAFGLLAVVPVPKAGAIVNAVFHDPDNEGVNKELWIFRRPIVPTLSDAAFTFTDAENGHVIGVITFSTWKTATSGQIGLTPDLPLWYVAPAGNLYLQIKTIGVDNIAAGSMPSIDLTIQSYEASD